VILVDTSVWIEHIRRGTPKLRGFLDEEDVLQHPFVTGELACGGLRDRPRTLRRLSGLRRAPIAEHDAVLRLIEEERLHGQGLTWVDVHLLASALVSRVPLWTNDRALERAASRLGVAA